MFLYYIRKLYLTIYNCANDIVNRNAMREKVKILHDSYLALYGIAKKTQFFSSALRKKVKCLENINVFSSQTTIGKKRSSICPKTRGAKDILKSSGSRLVSGKCHENKVIAVMAMASNPPCFWLHSLSASTSSSNIV